MKSETLAAICVTSTLLALSACATEDVPGPLLVASDQGGPDRGGVAIAFPPIQDTLDAYANAPQDSTQYYVFVDNQIVAAYQVGSPSPTSLVAVSAGTPVAMAEYLPAGAHHFAIAALGRAPIFQTDGQIPGAGTIHFFLFGPLNDLQAARVSIPDVPSAGNQHITVVNLLKSGQAIEVVSCTDATSCTPVSPPLALGDVFDGEFPAPVEGCVAGSATAAELAGGCSTSMNSQGAGIGYRLVPTASLPNPPVTALNHGFGGYPPRRLVAAPVFVTTDGQPYYVLF